jgi:hypothetical protein
MQRDSPIYLENCLITITMEGSEFSVNSDFDHNKWECTNPELYDPVI